MVQKNKKPSATAAVAVAPGRAAAASESFRPRARRKRINKAAPWQAGMAEPTSPEGAEESLFNGDSDDVDFVREAGDIARLASLQVDTATDDPEEALVSPPRPLVRVTSGGYIDGRPPPSPRGGPVLKEPKTARDRVWAFAFGLQLLGAVGVMVLKARSVDASPIVSIMLVAVMASLASLSDDSAGNALNAAHAPAILVVTALALLCGLRVERTHSIPWALLCVTFAVLALALYVSRRKAINDSSYVLATVALSRLVPWPRVSIIATAAQALHLLLVASVLRDAYMIPVLAHTYWTCQAWRLAVRAVVAADLERRLAGEGDSLKPLIRRACTTSLGTITKAALVCPPMELLRALSVDGLAPSTRRRRREACLGRALLRGKAFSAAARDVDGVIIHQNLIELLDGDAVVRGCRAGRAFVGASTSIICAALHSIEEIDPPSILSVGGSFLAGWVISSVALEPLASTSQATILCYAERPRGLEGADPILYRRFCRLAPSRPPRWVEPAENPLSPRRRSLSDTDYREVAL